MTSSLPIGAGSGAGAGVQLDSVAGYDTGAQSGQGPVGSLGERTVEVLDGPAMEQLQPRSGDAGRWMALALGRNVSASALFARMVEIAYPGPEAARRTALLRREGVEEQPQSEEPYGLDGRDALYGRNTG